MRAILLFTLSILLITQVYAQQAYKRHISIKRFPQSDSIHIPFNADYYLIEDSCAQITRRSRFNYDKFYGNFIDVSSTDPKQVIATGAYTTDGLKTGLFTTYYINGNKRAVGSYDQNEFSGIWHLYYESGKPKLTFSAEKGKVTIIDFWDENGTQFVSKGTGNYKSKLGALVWSGELLNGEPVGTWKATTKTGNGQAKTVTEKFENGNFIKGVGALGPYTDASRIVWVNLKDFPFVNAEGMAMSYKPCGFITKTGAYYRNGADAFSEEIKKHVSEYLKNVNLKPYENELNIEAEIAEDGRIINFVYRNAFNDRIASGIVSALRRLPSLEPARADGKPITQKFEIKFAFHSGVYRFNYRFMPL